MPEKSVVLANPSGLHARPAERFARAAARFDGKVTVRKAGKGDVVDAKSVLSVLTLGCLQGDEIVIQAEGEGAAEALEELVDLIAGDQGEDASG
jgi:phosphocarrier protein